MSAKTRERGRGLAAEGARRAANGEASGAFTFCYRRSRGRGFAFVSLIYSGGCEYLILDSLRYSAVGISFDHDKAGGIGHLIRALDLNSPP